MIISVSGAINSGKDTIAEYLVAEHGFTQVSFASNLKDVLSKIFNWDRELLEGKTELSREWREAVDKWWAARLGIPQLTPRWVMQHFATEVCRTGFHDDIWVASLEKSIMNTSQNVVISDCRFPNELKMVQRLGHTIHVSRGNTPDWHELAIPANRGSEYHSVLLASIGIHLSESGLIGTSFDYEMRNDGTLSDLYLQVDSIITDLAADPPVSM